MSVVKYFLLLHLCLCTTFIPSVYGGQKKVSEPLELEIQTVLSTQVVAGIFNLSPIQEHTVFFLTSKPSFPLDFLNFILKQCFVCLDMIT